MTGDENAPNSFDAEPEVHLCVTGTLKVLSWLSMTCEKEDHYACALWDPEGAVLAFYDMMKKGIVMPAHLVDDGKHASNNSGASLFMDYATVADSTGVYTTADYADIVDHLLQPESLPDRSLARMLLKYSGVAGVLIHPIRSNREHARGGVGLASMRNVSRWQVADLRFSGGKAEEAQQYLCQHADRVRRLANIQVSWQGAGPKGSNPNATQWNTEQSVKGATPIRTLKKQVSMHNANPVKQSASVKVQHQFKPKGHSASVLVQCQPGGMLHWPTKGLHLPLRIFGHSLAAA
eukprot:scaffold106179_cov18-Tisochrysis_lutea.AAC.1